MLPCQTSQSPAHCFDWPSTNVFYSNFDFEFWRLKGLASSLWPSDAIWSLIMATLILVNTCQLYGAKALPKPILNCQLNFKEQISMKIYLKLKTFHSRKCIWKYNLQGGSVFFPVVNTCMLTANIPHVHFCQDKINSCVLSNCESQSQEFKNDFIANSTKT